jgi:ribosomal protein L37AE/L43A
MAWKIVTRKLHRLRCPECERMYTEDEARELWECSREDCRETFVDDDRECPCCGSPFSRRLADFGCEDCLEALEEIHDKKDGTGTDDSHQREGVR